MDQSSANPATVASPTEITPIADIQPPQQTANLRQTLETEQAILAQLVREELASDSSTSLLTAKLKRLIHAETADQSKSVESGKQNYHPTLWILLQIPLLLATFGMTVYSTVYAKRNNDVAVQAVNAAQDANQVATEANRIAVQNANASIIQANNGASLNYLGIYQWCENNPNITFANGTSCSDILQQPVPYPTTNTVPTTIPVGGAHSLQLRGFVDGNTWIIIWTMLWFVFFSR